MSTGSDQGAHRGPLLLVHDDSMLLDYLGQIFDTRGFDVVAATTIDAAVALVRTRDPDVVIAGWEVAGAGTGELYRAVLDERLELRNQFVFLAHQEPVGLHVVIRGRTCAVDPWDVETLIRVTEEAAGRAVDHRSARVDAVDAVRLSEQRPSMLLVEDSPLELMAMKRVLDGFGFEVTPAECGNAAIAQLRTRSFEVILSDWFMEDGSGAELIAWLREHRPDMAERVVFMSGASPSDFEQHATGRPLLPKGQDSPVLIKTLMEIARR